MIKCHIIEMSDAEEFEEDLSRYLNRMKNREIMEIKFSTFCMSQSNYCIYTALIIYKTK